MENPKQGLRSSNGLPGRGLGDRVCRFPPPYVNFLAPLFLCFTLRVLSERSDVGTGLHGFFPPGPRRETHGSAPFFGTSGYWLASYFSPHRLTNVQHIPFCLPLPRIGLFCLASAFVGVRRRAAISSFSTPSRQPQPSDLPNIPSRPFPIDVSARNPTRHPPPCALRILVFSRRYLSCV